MLLRRRTPCWTSCFLEMLESRRLLAVDLSFGNFVLSGSPLFTSGGRTTLTVFIRGLAVGTTPTVAFKYLDVGFRADDVRASFDDPAAVALTSTAKDLGNSASPLGRSFSFDITYSPNMPQGRYELIG